MLIVPIFFICLESATWTTAGESGKMQGMTAAHNTIRNQLGIAPLVWSDTLAEYARDRAIKLAKKGCRMRHGPSGRYGENLYWASAVRWSNGKRQVQEINARHVADSWAQEGNDYNALSKKCRNGAICGHYTQMIWRDSKELGCGMAVCTDKGQIWVCNYNPPGNFIGQAPY
ncbi:MAG: CAP domain-containing protein [Desulfobulbaceae bacterium]|nr:CAP domain-containing protein [Desulfobulbaceae bacterium]